MLRDDQGGTDQNAEWVGAGGPARQKPDQNN